MRVPVYIALGCVLILGSTLGMVFSFPSISDSYEEMNLTYQEKNPVHLLFVGDMMFDRSVRKVAMEKGYDYILSCSKDRLATYDAVVGNLEGPITENKSRSMGTVPATSDNYVFTFAPEVAPVLKMFNIDIVNIGNNHITNFGIAGLASTTQYLAKAGVSSFGGVSGRSGVYRTTIKEKNISFVNFNEFGGDGPKAVINTIKKEKRSGQFVIVFTHWGDEYLPAPQRVQDIARVFVDAGANLIIGTHPHVVQKNETIGGVPVYYSLGNFVFDQYWNYDVSHGQAVEVTIAGDVVLTKSLPVTLGKDRRSCIGDDT